MTFTDQKRRDAQDELEAGNELLRQSGRLKRDAAELISRPIHVDAYLDRLDANRRTAQRKLYQSDGMDSAARDKFQHAANLLGSGTIPTINTTPPDIILPPADVVDVNQPLTLSNTNDWMDIYKQMTYQQNEYTVSVNDGVLRQRYIPHQNGSVRSQSGGILNTPSNQVTIRQKVMFEEGFDWGGRHKGGKFGFGLRTAQMVGAGVLDGRGTIIRPMWRDYGRVVIYSYHFNRPSYSDGKFWGANLDTGFVIAPEEWFTIEYTVRMNSAHDKADGWIEVLIEQNGLKWQSEFLQLQFMASGDLRFDRLEYQAFHGGFGPDWMPSRESGLLIRNVGVS